MITSLKNKKRPLQILMIALVIFSTIFITKAIILEPILEVPSEGSTNYTYENSHFNINATITCNGVSGTCGQTSNELYYYFRDEPKVVSLQNGTVSLSTTDTDITIASINRSRSMFFMSYTVDNAGPSQFLIEGELTSNTNIHFSRIGSAGSVAQISWYIVEFDQGVNTQYNSITQGATTNTAISSVNLSQTFPITYFENNGGAWGSDDGVRARLTTSTNLETSSTASLSASLAYQVVEFPYSNVQSGIFSLSGGTQNVDITPVDINKSFIVATRSSSGNINADDGGVNAYFTNSSRITFERVGTASTLNFAWHVVEFTTNEKVQHGTTSFGTTDTTIDVPINKVNLDKSIAIIPVGQKSGKTSYSSTDNPGATWFTITLTNETNLRLTRALSGSSTAQVSWSVIEFEGDAPAGTRPITTSGSPFTTQSNQPQTCNLDFGETCSVEWHVNTTETAGNKYNLFVLTKSNQSYITYNISGNSTINITNDIWAPKWSNNNVNPSTPTTYSPSKSYYFNITWNDNDPVLNDTSSIQNVTIEHNFTATFINESMNQNGNIFTYNITNISAGSYSWKSHANDASNNLNSTNFFTYIINKAPTNLNLTSNKNWITINGTQTNVSCYADNNEVNVTLYRNGSLVGSSKGGIVNDIQTLSIGSHPYICNVSASQNYSQNSESNSQVITDKAIPICSLSFNPITGNKYPVNLNVSCSCSNPETSAQLFRNGTNVTNEINTLVNLAAGNYSYECNSTETATYSANSNSTNYEILKGDPIIDFKINDTASNYADNVVFNTNISCSVSTPGFGNLNITQDGIELTSGLSPLSTLETYNTSGIKELSCIYEENQNYSSSISYLNITSTDITNPEVYLEYPPNATIISDTRDIIINVTATDNQGLSNCTLYTNITGSWSANETKTYTGTNDTLNWTFTNLPNTDYIYNALCYDVDGNSGWSSSNHTFTVYKFPNISINTPLLDTVDFTPILNITLHETVSQLWYNINNDSNKTICSDCTGNQIQNLILEEDNYTINVFANDSFNVITQKVSNFEIFLNYSHYDNYKDNTSLREFSSTTFNNGNITFDSGSLKNNLSVILICATGTCTSTTSDVPIKNLISNDLGYNLTTIIDTDTTWDTSAYDVAVISESVNSGNTAWLKSETIPIVTTEGANWDEYDFGTGGGSNTGSSTAINITNTSHYITEIFTENQLVTVSTSTNDGDMTGWSNDVQKLAHYSGTPTSGKLLVVESGGTLADSTIAAERRVFLGYFNANNANANGKNILNRSIDWAGYNTGIGAKGNFTSHTINLTQNITSFLNITWDEYNTDANHTITVQVSPNNGHNWYNATNGGSILGVNKSNQLVYRVLFETQTAKILTIDNINISWTFIEEPIINLISPSNSGSILTKDNSTLTFEILDTDSSLNCELYIDGILNKTTTCNTYEVLSENLNLSRGLHNWSVAANDSDGNYVLSNTWQFKITDNQHKRISKAITSQSSDTYLENIRIENILNYSEDLIITEFINRNFSVGVVVPLQDFINITNGPNYFGNIYGWNLTVLPLSINEINVTIGRNGPSEDFFLAKAFTLGLD